MNELKLVIAKNIADLRRREKLTQLELAERLSYSDKAVSKWERGESMPDVSVLKNIAELFGVTIDYLVTEEHENNSLPRGDSDVGRSVKNRGFITGMSIVLVWLIATLITVLSYLFQNKVGFYWLAFVYAVPVSVIVWLVLNSVWFDKRRNFQIISLLMWSVIGALYVSLLMFGINSWPVFIICIPGQAIIFMWSFIKRSK